VFLATAGNAGDRPGMKRAIPIFRSFGTVGFLVFAVAFVSPPDPWWITGIYDGADGDDAAVDDVVTHRHETAAVTSVPKQPFPPLSGLSEMLIVSRSRVVPGFPAMQFTRGPPSSAAPIPYRAPSRLQSLARFHSTRSPPDHRSSRPLSAPNPTLRSPSMSSEPAARGNYG